MLYIIFLLTILNKGHIQQTSFINNHCAYFASTCAHAHATPQATLFSHYLPTYASPVQFLKASWFIGPRNVGIRALGFSTWFSCAKIALAKYFESLRQKHFTSYIMLFCPLLFIRNQVYGSTGQLYKSDHVAFKHLLRAPKLQYAIGEVRAENNYLKPPLVLGNTWQSTKSTINWKESSSTGLSYRRARNLYQNLPRNLLLSMYS